jgi:hypothetical protein
MDWIRGLLGYEVSAPLEHERVDRRLQAQRLRLNALDAGIQAQNAAPVKPHPPRRATDR